MISFYVIRHGETLFNVQNKIQGWCDSPLTEKGIAQAKQVGEALYNVPFTRAYCSTSERCVDTTAYILMNRDVAVIPKKALKELNFGILEGDAESKIFSKNAKAIYEQGFEHLGGESLTGMRDRLMKGLQDIADHETQGNLLVVTHGGAIRGIIEAIQPGTLGMKDNIDNCSLMRIEYDGAFHLLSYNEHLG